MNVTETGGAIIDAAAHGLRPDTGADMVPAARRLLAACQGRRGTVVLAPGRYDFFHEPGEEVTIAFHLRGLEGITLDGGGAAFVFHGLMMPVRIEDCADIRLRDFTVDWQRPFISQGRIVEAAAGHLDLAIDRAAYPYEVAGGRVWFTSPDWDRRRGVDGYGCLWHRETKEILHRTRDNPLGIDFNGPAEEIAPGVLRFHAAPRCRPEPGTYLTLNHGRYIVKGIDIVRCRAVALEDIVLHHVLSGGVVAARCDGLSIVRVDLRADESKGRVFSGVADAFHLIHCKGHVEVRECTHTGHGDDFLNLHGRNSVVVRRLGARTVRAVRADCSEAGDEMWLIRQCDVQRREVLRIASIRRVPIENPLGLAETRVDNGIAIAWGLSTDKQGEWEVEFDADLPADLAEGDCFENRTWNASLTMTGCNVLRRHRARGVLVTTPEPVRIEGNTFRTAGAAILIEGDTDHWFESGACTEVLIRGNIFEDCLTSGSDTGNRWEWGEAVITISPSHRPADADTEPYHRGIRIEGNVFRAFDAPLLAARSVRGLSFSGNRVEGTATVAPFLHQRSSVDLDGCREVRVQDNRHDQAYRPGGITTAHMRPSDLTVDEASAFTIGSDQP